MKMIMVEVNERNIWDESKSPIKNILNNSTIMIILNSQ